MKKFKIGRRLKNNRPTLNGKPCRYLSQGSYKTAWKAGKYVIKISATDEVIREYRFYRSLPPTHKQYFVPIYQAGRITDNSGNKLYYSVQKYISGKHLDPFIHKYWHSLRDRYDLGDMHCFNFRKNGKKIVCVDYGLHGK